MGQNISVDVRFASEKRCVSFSIDCSTNYCRSRVFELLKQLKTFNNEFFNSNFWRIDYGYCHVSPL